MTRVYSPYGSQLTSGRKSQISKRDTRMLFCDRRLLWQDGISAHDGKLVLTSRSIENGKINSEASTLFTATKFSGNRIQKAPIAFQPAAESSTSWNRIEISDMQVCLKDFHRVHDVCEAVRSLGVPVDQGRNPLLCTHWRGKKVLIPTLTLMTALLMPSDSVFLQFAHPMMGSYYVRQPAQPGHIEIRSSTNYSHMNQFKWNELCCMAYWLSQDENLWDISSLYEATFGEADFQLAPIPEIFKLCVAAYEFEDLIVVQHIGAPELHSIWPIENTTITVSNLSGKATHSIAIGPAGILLRHLEYLGSSHRHSA